MTRRLRLLATFALLGGALVVVPATPASAVAISWTQTSAVTGLTDANDDHVVDIDGDGAPDILATEIGSNDLELATGNGDGTFDAPITIDAALPSAHADVESGDLDNDGDLDVVVTGDGMVWVEQAGGGVWTQHVIAASGDIGGGFNVEVIDMDSDGWLDVAVADALGATSWYQNDETPAVGDWTEVASAPAGLGQEDLASGDLDNDGDIDLVGTSPNDDTIQWFESDPDTPSLTAIDIPTTLDYPRRVAVADLDRDGDLDVAVASNTDQEVRWYENTGDAASFTEHAIDLDYGSPRDLDPADIDRDGDIDLVATDTEGTTVDVFENDGSGADWSRRTVGDTGEISWRIAIADDDLDGDLDLFAVALGTTVERFENETIHSTPDTPEVSTITGAVAGANGVAVADLDLDGALDVAMVGSGGSVHWVAGEGSGGFGPVTLIDAALVGPQKIVATDIDGDADDDLVVTVYDGGGVDDDILWYENGGPTGTGDPGDFGVPGSGESVMGLETTNGPTTVRPADLDRDGDMDLVSNADLTGRVLYHLNTAGDGSAWAVSDLDGLSGSNETDVFDGDNDGDLDIVISEFIDGQITWYESDGGAPPFFTPFVEVIDTIDGATRLAHGDLDGDGDIDLLSASATNDTVQWHENDGDPGDGGWFTDVIATVDNPQAIVAEDFDQDGDLDVMTAGLDDEVAWHENTAGDGSAWTEIWSDTSMDGPDDLAVGDLDRDGVTDVVIPSTFDSTVQWLPIELDQMQVDPTGTAPADATPSGEDEIFSVDVTHLGIATDHDERLSRGALVFGDGDGDPLSEADVEESVAAVNLYLDDGPAGFDGEDELIDSFTDLPLDVGGFEFDVTDTADAVVAEGTVSTFLFTLEFTDSPSDLTVSFVDLQGVDADADAEVPLRERITDTPTIEIAGADDPDPAPGGGGGSDPDPILERRGGVDRYATAAMMNSDLAPGVDVAYVATGQRFPDALATGPIAGLADAALVLVELDSIPAATAAELERLAPDEIVVVGGTAAVSDDVVDQLGAYTDGDVRRVAGVDRYGTAAALSADAFPDGAPSVHIVSGEGFADAVAAGPAAAAAGGPILLVTRDEIPAVTAAELTRLGPGAVVLVGGSAVIGPDIDDRVGELLPDALVTSVAGADRYETAAALADGRVGPSTDLVYVATGADYADALSAAPQAVRRGAQLLLVPRDGTLPGDVDAVLDQAGDADLVVVGGSAAVSDAMVAQLR